VTGGGGFTTITYDDFESGMGSYTDGGSDMSRYTGGTYAWQGNAAADIQDNSGTASSFYTTTTRNVSGYVTQEIEFYFVAVSMETGENFFVEYFNGSVWQIVANYVAGTSFNNLTWYVATVTLTNGSYTFPTNARIRFRCDASNNADDVYIDQITWRGSASAATSTTTMGDPVALNRRAVDEPSLAPENETPAMNSLGQNYPNPFNPRTTIAYTLASEARVTIDVFDVSGRRVATLVDDVKGAGHHVAEFDASALASGVYFYRLTAGAFVEKRRMVLLK
jgi:hypothetical protein